MRIYLLPLSLYLIPFQFLGLKIYSSRLDLSAILLVIWFFLWVPRRNIIITIITFIFFVIYSYFIAILFENPFSFSRLINASFFYSILINCFFVKKSLSNQEIKYSILSIFLSLITCLFLVFFKPFLPIFLANQGFIEPSFANLFYCSLLLFGILDFIKNKFSKKNFIMIIGSIFLLLLTRGIHLVSFTISLLIVVFALNIDPIKKFFSNFRSLNKRTLITILLFLIFLPLALLILNSEYFSSRILTVLITTSQDNANISGLVWLGGLIQVKEAFLECGIFGCGAGSPGVFSDKIFIPLIECAYGACMSLDELQLNRFDCYSLMFRSLVEFGIFSLLVWSYALINIIKSIKINFLKRNNNNEFPFISFLLTFFIGSLIKEPHLYTSITFLPLTLLIIKTNSFNIKKSKS